MMLQDELRLLEKEEEEAEEEEEEEKEAETRPRKHRLNEDSHKPGPGDVTEFCHLSKRAKIAEGQQHNY